MKLSDFQLYGLLKYDFPLSSVTSMKTGGNAKYAFFPENKEQLRQIISFLRESNIKYIVVGFTSNILFKSAGYNGAVVFTINMKDFYYMDKADFCADYKNLSGDYGLFYAEAGASLTKFSNYTLKNGYDGLEFAFGIPASVGGAIYMNAGAYGGEISKVLYCVEYLDANGEFKILYNDGLLFSYRHSPFSEMNESTIVGGVFKLVKSYDDSAINTAHRNMQSRREKQPLEYPSCGSAFKRPVGYYAGALIEQAGLKGYSIGGASVSDKHAGFIINKNNATTEDVLQLIEYVRDTVYREFGVLLEPEIRIIE